MSSSQGDGGCSYPLGSPEVSRDALALVAAVMLDEEAMYAAIVVDAMARHPGELVRALVDLSARVISFSARLRGLEPAAMLELQGWLANGHVDPPGGES